MELLSVDQVAEELELSTNTVRVFCQQGRIGTKVGNQWIITRAELEAFKATPRPVGRPSKGEEES